MKNTIEKVNVNDDDASGGGGRGIVRPATPVEKLCYTVPEAGALLGFSRNHSYELARQGEIPVIKIGSRIVVPKKKFHDKFGYPINDE